MRRRAAWLAAGLLCAGAPASAGPGNPFDMRAVCRDDFERLCRELGNEAPRAEIERCLASHEDELSPACRTAVGDEPEDAPPTAPGDARHRPPGARPPAAPRTPPHP